jgi:hypothetical protein
MLKTSLGLAALDAGEPWPDKNQMRRWGHNLLLLNDEAVPVYECQVARSTAPGFIQQLLEQCRDDATLHLLLGLLSSWGTQGRFHRLDELAGTSQSGESPQAMWEALESRVLASKPTLLEQLGEPHGYDAARSHLNTLIGESFRNWWQLHTRAWMTGVIGADAKGLASILSRALAT